MLAIFVLLNVFLTAITSDIHVANDNYFLRRAKRQVPVLCKNGINSTVRTVFDNTIAAQKNWDCDLEQTASAVIVMCLLDNGGANQGTLKLSFDNTNKATAESVLIQNERALALASSNLNDLTAGKDTIGCAYASCQNRVDILCLYK